MKTTLDILTMVFLVIFGLQVVATRAAFGSLFLASSATMIRVTLRGPKVLLLICGVLGLLGASFQPQYPPGIPPFPPLLLAALSLLALNGACLPPAVLYLAASRRDSWTLVWPLQRAAVPLKFVHLLDSSLEIQAFTRSQVRQTGFRVWSKADWQLVVRQLSGIAPIVIVDGRAETPSLIHEIHQIIKSGFHRRTFFLCDRHGKCKALSKIDPQGATNLRLTTPERLLRSLHGIGWLCIMHESVVPSSLLAQRLGLGSWLEP